MKERKLLKKVISGITACSIGIASLGIASCTFSGKDYVGNLKY